MLFLDEILLLIRFLFSTKYNFWQNVILDKNLGRQNFIVDEMFLLAIFYSLLIDIFHEMLFVAKCYFFLNFDGI